MIDVSDLMGVPFVDRGRDPKIGLDCYGLFAEVIRRATGVVLPDFKISCFASALISKAAQEEILERWVTAQPSVGAAVVIANEPAAPELIQHFGVMVDNRRFIHTLKKTGPLLTKIDDSYWGKKIKGFYSWNG